MPVEDTGTEIGELAEGEDLELLEAEAVKQGVPVGMLAKRGIQQIFAQRTRPKPMKGIVQAFRR
ncbi:hypothetical protein PS870_02052 [Pseudomonas fluorescens]|uniref:Uncharacterized protein n=1 Tax=Pseudomonas fluorescens TaxID=294 RepID=A0A5E7J969_PSEFL|nr:hypothetical protein [Pseudomonas fluorescens]VVO85881.1 hypothetical protein PS870_02052 [Pseudomonas fluorescens]